MGSAPLFYDSRGVRDERYTSLRDAKAALSQQIERQRQVIEDHDRQADRYGAARPCSYEPSAL